MRPPAALALLLAASTASAFFLPPAGPLRRRTAPLAVSPAPSAPPPRPGTVAALREECRAEGLRVSGTKAVLIERLDAAAVERAADAVAASLQEAAGADATDADADADPDTLPPPAPPPKEPPQVRALHPRHLAQRSKGRLLRTAKAERSTTAARLAAVRHLTALPALFGEAGALSPRDIASMLGAVRRSSSAAAAAALRSADGDARDAPPPTFVPAPAVRAQPPRSQADADTEAASLALNTAAVADGSATLSLVLACAAAHRVPKTRVSSLAAIAALQACGRATDAAAEYAAAVRCGVQLPAADITDAGVSSLDVRRLDPLVARAALGAALAALRDAAGPRRAPLEALPDFVVISESRERGAVRPCPPHPPPSPTSRPRPGHAPPLLGRPARRRRASPAGRHGPREPGPDTRHRGQPRRVAVAAGGQVEGRRPGTGVQRSRY